MQSDIKLTAFLKIFLYFLLHFYFEYSKINIYAERFSKKYIIYREEWNLL